MSIYDNILHSSVSDAQSSIGCLLANSRTVSSLTKLRRELANTLNACSTEEKTLYRVISSGIRKCDQAIRNMKS
jgi:hypothetical protein